MNLVTIFKISLKPFPLSKSRVPYGISTIIFTLLHTLIANESP